MEEKNDENIYGQRLFTADRDSPKGCTTIMQQPHRFWITTATSTRRRFMRTVSSKISHRYGSAATIINGASCVPAAWTNASLQATLPTKRKFLKWAEVLGKAIGNPLFHWSHLELQKYFGYHGVLNKSTAEEVWELCTSASPSRI